MNRYARFSGVFFGVIALAQLTRTVFRWPVRIADVAVPVWASALAFVVASTFAVWAFRTARTAS